MVSITPFILLGLIGLAVIFNKEIASFLREFKPSEQFQEVVETITEPITQAGVTTGKAVGEAILPINIFLAEKEIEQKALDLGFPSLAEAEKALDAGSVVIGGTKNIVDVGLIGNVLPTDPSPEFLANPEKFLTPTQLEAFRKQQEALKGTTIQTTTPVIASPSPNPTSPTETESIFDVFASFLFGGQTSPNIILTKDTVTDPTRGELRFGR